MRAEFELDGEVRLTWKGKSSGLESTLSGQGGDIITAIMNLLGSLVSNYSGGDAPGFAFHVCNELVTVLTAVVSAEDDARPSPANKAAIGRLIAIHKILNVLDEEMLKEVMSAVGPELGDRLKEMFERSKNAPEGLHSPVPEQDDQYTPIDKSQPPVEQADQYKPNPRVRAREEKLAGIRSTFAGKGGTADERK